MAIYKYTQNSFSTGEIDPKSTGLIGTVFMQSALKKSRGFMALPAGGVMRVPGTKYIVGAYKTGYCRMEELYLYGQPEYDVSTGVQNAGSRLFVFEFYDLFIRILEFGVYANENEIISTQTMTSVYGANDLKDLSIVANKGILYVAHSRYPLGIFTYDTTLFFQKTNPTYTEIDFATEDNYPSIVAFKGGRMIVASTNNNPNTIWQSRTPDEGDRYTDFTLYDYYTELSVVLDSPALDDLATVPILDNLNIKITYITYSTGAASDYKRVSIYTNISANAVVPVVSVKTTITETGTASSNITETLRTQETTSTDALGETTFTYSEPLTFTPPTPTLVTTETSTNTEITKQVYSTHAIETQETDMYGSRILWVAPMGRLTVATSKSIFIDNGEIATPSTFDLYVSVYQGVGKTANRSIRNYNIFLGINKKTVYMSYYSYESESLVTFEVSKNARSLIKSGVADFTIMFEPFPIIWIVTNEGKLVSCLLNFTSDGTSPSWSIQETDENRRYISLCASGVNSNFLFLNVASDYDSGTEYTFERIEMLEEFDTDNSFFMDMYVNEVSETLITEVTGLPYQDGTILEVIVDNHLLERKVCNSGTITVTNAGYNFKIGLPKTSYMEFFNPILSSNGISISTIHRVKKLFLRLYESGVAKLSSSTGGEIPIIYKRFGDALFGDEIELHSLDLAVDAPSTNNTENTLKIIVDEPFAFNLLAISYTYNITEE